MKSPTDPYMVRRLQHLIIATGIASVTGQLVFMREYQAQFQGNEMVIALVLALWLLLGGIGTRLAQGSAPPSRSRLIRLCFLLAGLSGSQLLVVRGLRWVVFGRGISVGFYPILGFTLLTLAPYALLVGYLLPYSLRVIRSVQPDFAGTRAYLADNLGDACGGALFAFGLVFWLTPLQAMLAAHLPLIAAAWRAAAPPFLRSGVGAAAALVLLTAGLFCERPSLTPGEAPPLTYVESRYARLIVEKQAEQVTLYADGQPLAGSYQTDQAEAAVHYPLSQLNRPARILLMSIQGGMLAEIAKHRPTAVDYIELDPAAARLLFQYHIIDPIPGLQTIHTDGRRWLNRTDRVYDAILINLPEPDTLQLNRFFTDQFFQSAKAHLAADGILSFGVEGFANTMSETQSQKLSALRATVQRHFRQVQLLPGERIYFLCRDLPIDLDIPRRLVAQDITAQAITAYYYGDITAERIASLSRDLRSPAPVNQDTHPYLMQIMLDQWFTKFGTSPVFFFAALAAGLVIYLIRRSRQEIVLFTSGWMIMGSEILVLFAYQIFFGYIYVRIGVIVTVFLAGLLPGAWLGLRWAARSGRLLLASEILLILLMATAAGMFFWAGGALPSGIYYLWGFIVSLLGGLQFPLALAMLGDGPTPTGRLISVDLVGAACGALVTGTLLVPYLGLVGTTAALIGLKLISLSVMGGRYANP